MSVLLPTAASLLETLSAKERKKLLSLARKIMLRPGETVDRPELDADTVGIVDAGAFIERLYYGARSINVSRETGSSLFNKLRRKGVIAPGKFIKVELSRLSEYAATLE
jgi:hypothetical protein